MMPDEVRRLKGKKCLVFIRGYDPIIDDKIHTLSHPFWNEVCECEKKYDFDERISCLKYGRYTAGKLYRRKCNRKLLNSNL